MILTLLGFMVMGAMSGIVCPAYLPAARMCAEMYTPENVLQVLGTLAMLDLIILLCIAALSQE